MNADGPERTAVGGIAEILASAVACLGVPGTRDTLGLAEMLSEPRQIAVMLIDGLGFHLLPLVRRGLLCDVWSAHADPAAPSAGAGALRELVCAFPSTTPTSLATLGTGALPGEHGVLGFTVSVPGADTVLTHVRWHDDPPVHSWVPVPALLDRALAAGVGAAVVARAEYRRGGLTRAVYGDNPTYRNASGHRQLARGMVTELARGTGLVFGYLPDLDAVMHQHGIASRHWQSAAADVGTLIERVAAALPAGAALLVTADHGGLDIPAANRLDCGTDPELAAGLRLVAGEPRARYLHTRPGAAVDVQDAWRARLGDAAIVHTREQAIAAGWFGPVRAEHGARIGDLVVACTRRNAVLATGWEPARVAELVGMHGSVLPEETAIPLIAFTNA